MRKALYFSKPQPLSPSSKTWVEGNTRYQKNKNAVGGKTSVKGVPTTDSIYYLWFEYLKRNNDYKTACANNGKGMTKIYKDFGNIFEYKGKQLVNVSKENIAQVPTISWRGNCRRA